MKWTGSAALRSRAFWAGGALGIAIGLAGFFFGAVPMSGTAAEPAGRSVTPVFEEELSNLPGYSLAAVVVDYAPGGHSASHRHAGPVFAYVLEGQVRSKLDDGPAVVYQGGESFFEPLGTHHVISENASGTESAKLLAVFVAQDGATLTTFDE